MMSTEATRFATVWIDAWNRRDVDAILGLYADDVVLTSPLAARWLARTDGTLHGLDELRDYVATGLDSAPGLHLEPRHTLVGVDSVTVVYARETGTLVAEVMQLTAAGTVWRAHTFFLEPQLSEWVHDWPPD
jgi:ketosteroid isomerase-like protein